jgi:GT2 family glycosyltransferase
MVGFLEQRPDVDVVYAGYTRRHANGEEESLECEPPENLAEVNVVRACFLFRREVWERVGHHDETLPCAEDYEFWLRVAASGLRLAPLQEDLYVYRLHDGSLTAQRAQEVMRNTFIAQSRHLPSLRGWPARARARGHRRLAETARQMGDLAAFRRHFLRALFLSPGVVFRRGRTARQPGLEFLTLAFGIRFTEGVRRAYGRMRGASSRRPPSH